MASSTRLPIVCILLILVIVNYARSQSGAEKGPAAAISGKVTIKGKAAAGVTIAVRTSDFSNGFEPTYKAVTDLQGLY